MSTLTAIPSSPNSSTDFVPDRTPASSPGVDANLDLLRAFAVGLVFFGHLLYFHGSESLGPLHLNLMGALGVLLFFVHTCCVLMLSLERQTKQLHKLRFCLAFLIRRSFRIYPLSIVVVLLVAIFHLPLGTVSPGHFAGFKPDGGDLIANLFLVMNLSHRTPILGPMWSLPYEMQMYLFLPWLFLLIRPNRGLWRVAGIWVLAITAVLGWITLRHSSSPNLATYIPCFLPGIIAYQLQRKIQPCFSATLWAPVVVLLAGLFLCGTTEENWPIRWALCLAVGVAIPLFRRITSPWLVISTHLVSKYSYGIYLSQFFCIWFAFEYLRHWSLPEKWTVFLVLASGLPVFFYHLLEEPMIRLGKKIAIQYETSPSELYSGVEMTTDSPTI